MIYVCDAIIRKLLPGEFRPCESRQTLSAYFYWSMLMLKQFQNLKFSIRILRNTHSNVLSWAKFLLAASCFAFTQALIINHWTFWLSSRNFFQGAKSIVMQISIVILLFSDQISGRGKKFQGENCLRGAPPAPLWKKAIISILKWACKVLHRRTLRLVEKCFGRFPGITWYLMTS